MNTVFIFALLVALMLTGMPISISLGLTVLSFLFFMTQVPIESVALKLFTGIEKFEIMAIPFFILAGNFLTHGGVAKRMIRFATSMVGHFHGGLGLAGVLACALFTGIVGTLGATFVWENGAHHAIFHALGIATDTPEGPTTPDLETPTWIVYSAVPLGSYLMCFRFLQVTWGFLRTGELPHHDQTKVEGVEEPGDVPPGEEDKIYRMEDDLHPRDVPEAPKDDQP